MNRQVKMLICLIAILIFICITFVACDQMTELEKQQRQDYALYVAYADENGEMPMSYEDWLLTIKGDTGEQGPQGEKGDKGDTGADGLGIAKIEKTSIDGLVDTYTITFTDSSTTIFTVTNGVDGENGSQGIQGIQGVPGKDGHTPVITIIDGYWYIDGVNSNQLAQGVPGIQGPQGETGQMGEDGKSAFEIWVEQPGNEGKSEEDFFAYLRGECVDHELMSQIVMDIKANQEDNIGFAGDNYFVPTIWNAYKNNIFVGVFALKWTSDNPSVVVGEINTNSHTQVIDMSNALCGDSYNLTVTVVDRYGNAIKDEQDRDYAITFARALDQNLDAETLTMMKSILNQLYVNSNPENSYSVISVINANSQQAQIKWSVDIKVGEADSVKVGKVIDNECVIDVNSQPATDVQYTLTATLTNAKGQAYQINGEAVSISFERSLPEFIINTYEEYLLACEADEGYKIRIKAYVIGVICMESSSKGSMYLQDADGNGYYAYKPVGVTDDCVTTEQLYAKWPIGTEVYVYGACQVYSGMYEFVSGCEVQATGNNIEEAELAYINATESFANANSSEDTSLLLYQGRRVELKNATITRIVSSYYYFTLPNSDVEFYLYCHSYLVDQDVISAISTLLTVGSTVDLRGIITVYSKDYQIYPDSINSVVSLDGDNGSVDTGNDSDDVVAAENITLTFRHTMGSALRNVLDMYIKEFNVIYPNITIEHEQVGGYGDVLDQNLMDMALGDGFYITYAYPDHVAKYNLGNYTISLERFIESNSRVPVGMFGNTSALSIGLSSSQIADFYPSLYNAGSGFGDSHTYFLPFSASTELLYYNKDFFVKNALNVPTHWWCTDSCADDCSCSVEYVCAQIKAIDPTSIPLGIDSEGNFLITLCEQLGIPYASSTGNHYLFNNPQMQSLLLRLREWYCKGWLTTQEIYGAYTSGLFVNQDETLPRSYMTIGSSAGATHQRPAKLADGTYPFEVGVAQVPQADQSNCKIISQGINLCLIGEGSENEKLAAWLFMKYLTTSAEFQAAFSNASGYMPVIKSASDRSEAAYDENNQPTNAVAIYVDALDGADGFDNFVFLALKQCINQSNCYFLPPSFAGSAILKDELGQLFENSMILTGSLTDSEDKILALLQDAYDACEQKCPSQM